MMRAIKNLFLIISLIFIAGCSKHQGTLPDKGLWEVTDLKDALDAGLPVKVIDMQKQKEYLTAHIPGAINITREELENKDYPYKGMLAAKVEVEDLLGRSGINPGDFIVIYDAKGDVDAARLWWALKVYGHSRTALLNGGLQAWTKDQPSSSEKTEVSAASYSFMAEGNTAFLADKSEVSKCMQDQSSAILDVRSTEEYTGSIVKEHAFRPGHIPGSIHIDYVNALDENLFFKPADELKELYRTKGITPDKKIMVYCHSGVRSAHTLFALTELLGYKNVHNYDGSWIEWSYFQNLPAEKSL